MLQGGHSAILSTFIKLLFVIKVFVLPIFEWPLETCFYFTDILNVPKNKIRDRISLPVCFYDHH